jgi:hypothetical protein
MVGLRQTIRDLLRSLSADAPSSRRTEIAGRISAQDCGIQLLTRNLSRIQREQYERRGYFDVIGGDTGKRYRIRYGHQMNVEQLDQKGRTTHVLCFMPRGELPVGDIMLAQKIALELYEAESIKVANRLSTWSSFAVDTLQTSVTDRHRPQQHLRPLQARQPDQLHGRGRGSVAHCRAQSLAAHLPIVLRSGGGDSWRQVQLPSLEGLSWSDRPQPRNPNKRKR